MGANARANVCKKCFLLFLLSAVHFYFISFHLFGKQKHIDGSLSSCLLRVFGFPQLKICVCFCCVHWFIVSSHMPGDAILKS